MADQLVVDASYVESSSFPKKTVVTEDVLSFIDQINSPRRVNPLDLAPQLVDAFSLTEREARSYLVLWLRLFSKRYIQGKETVQKSTVKN